MCAQVGGVGGRGVAAVRCMPRDRVPGEAVTPEMHRYQNAARSACLVVMAGVRGGPDGTRPTVGCNGP